MESAIRTVPPLIQVLILVGLGAYVALSIAARLNHQLGNRIWDPDRQPHTREHLIQYTLIPALVFVGAVAAVVSTWDSSGTWLADWSPFKATVKVSLCVFALSCVITGSVLGKRIDTSDARRFRSWIPFLFVILGIFGIFGMVFLPL